MSTIIEKYLAETQARIAEASTPERQKVIEQVAELCAAAIAEDRLVHTFGTGHGSFAPLEMFPRTGTCVGFHPIVETSLGNFSNIFGDFGLSQYRYLHTNEGFGRAILDSHHLISGDLLILFSHSGINNVIVDMALAAREQGLAVVGVTSVPHSSNAPARHSSGKRLFEVADFVIDTGVPINDASLYIDDFPYPVGPTSTVVASAVAHAIVVGTIEKLLERGETPYVMVNPNTADVALADEQNAKNLEETWRLFKLR
jgi:uncharacterized phosphosugar-binding protein